MQKGKMNMELNRISFMPFYTAVSGDKNIEEQTKVDQNFSKQMKELAIEGAKTEIHEKFGIDVNVADEESECWIPGEVLYRMNSNDALKEKVYATLAEYAGTKFQMTKAALYPPVKKSILTFDKNGDSVTTLEPDMEYLEQEVGRSGKKKYAGLFDCISLEPYDDNSITDDTLYDPNQDFELQRAVLAADYIKKRSMSW